MENQSQLVQTARVAGFWYLMMAIAGVLGFIVVHSQVFDQDPQKTLANLVELQSLARVRVLLEFAIVVTQALTALWFFKLFRKINDWAAWATGIWGMVNAVVIMISAIAMITAIEIANTSTAVADKVIFIELLSNLSTHAWGVGGLFFGLWLIPLGYIVSSSKRLPVWLGRTLILGGIGYILSTVINYSGLGYSFSQYFTLPATVGEFWMIGYLLIFGIRPASE